MSTKILSAAEIIEYSIEEAKPVFWLQDFTIDGVEIIIEAEMSYLGVTTDIVFKKHVNEVLSWETWMGTYEHPDDEWTSQEMDVNRWLDKQAKSFKAKISQPLSNHFKNLFESWNK